VLHLPLWIGQRVGRRGFALLFFAFLDFVYGFSLLNPPKAGPGATLAFVDQVMPLSYWGVLWVGVGVVCLIGAFVRQDRWAFAAAMALKTLWGTVMFLGWALFSVDRGWVSAAIWLVFAVWVYIISTWPEPGRWVNRPPREEAPL
jgi:hypothetical protein